MREPGLRLIHSLPLTHPAGFVYVARFPSAPFPPGTFTYRICSGSEKVRTKSVQVHVYEVRPRKDRRGFDLMSDSLPFRLWYAKPSAVNNAVDYAKHRSRSHHAVIRVVMTLAT